jgi:hypothetical protein
MQSAAEESFSQDELDALLAPIALYPDTLLSQVLMASTYPLEVVLADRFLKEDPGLYGEALDEALAEKNWDPSVQSLAAYPKVLAMMSEKLEWTEYLGDAFLEDEGRVMDTLQALRRRAQAAGNLQSTAEASVVDEDETISIQPAEPDVVYVPDYDSEVVYGVWYESYYHYYRRYYGHASVSGTSVSYSTSYRIDQDHWDWAHADWHGRRLTLSVGDNRFWDGPGRASTAPGSAWQHDSLHRRGDRPRPAGDRGRRTGFQHHSRYPGAQASGTSFNPK